MRRNLFRIAAVAAAIAMVLSLNAFAAVGDSVANVFLKKQSFRLCIQQSERDTVRWIPGRCI